MKDFSLKFLDVMVGLVLGLGFQWWPNLMEPWQYIAFVFVYFDIIDHWIDYSPQLKKFPPKRELDILLNIGLMFAFFLYIYTTQMTPVHFFGAFLLFRALDFVWLLSSKQEYRPSGSDKTYVDVWLRYNVFEILVTLGLLAVAYFYAFPALYLILVYVGIRVMVRIFASWQYKKVHFV
ncbi:MAG: hypothetical protein HY457_02300 [Parcubacteria group bacterium]|nr:hypothetical protein [Parcubacteria group bacterium]